MRVCLIGIGNELCTDDAVGIEIVKNLQVRAETREIPAFLIGGDLLAISTILQDYDIAWVIDAFSPGPIPGSIGIFEYETEQKMGNIHLSMHDMDLFWNIRCAYERGFQGRVFFIGVTTFCIAPGFGLSLEMQNELGGVIDNIGLRIKEFINSWHNA